MKDLFERKLGNPNVAKVQVKASKDEREITDSNVTSNSA